MCHNSYKNSLEATQIENKINQLEENEVDVDILTENYKEFTKKNNNSILKSQQR